MRRTVGAFVIAVALIVAACGDDDDDSGVDEVEQPVEVSEQLTIDPSEGVAPLTVSFTVEDRFFSGADEATYAWRFGDGSSATGREVSHTYLEEGTYDVALVATSPDETREYHGLVRVYPEFQAEGDGEENPVDDAPTAPDPDVVDQAIADLAARDYSEWEMVDFDPWVEGINAACAEAFDASLLVTGPDDSPEALAAYIDITNAESAAMEAAGIPTTRTEEAISFLETRDRGAMAFLGIAGTGVVDPADPALEELNEITLELIPIGTSLGAVDCLPQQ